MKSPETSSIKSKRQKKASDKRPKDYHLIRDKVPLREKAGRPNTEEAKLRNEAIQTAKKEYHQDEDDKQRKRLEQIDQLYCQLKSFTGPEHSLTQSKLENRKGKEADIEDYTTRANKCENEIKMLIESESHKQNN